MYEYNTVRYPDSKNDFEQDKGRKPLFHKVLSQIMKKCSPKNWTKMNFVLKNPGSKSAAYTQASEIQSQKK